MLSSDGRNSRVSLVLAFALSFFAIVVSNTNVSPQEAPSLEPPPNIPSEPGNEGKRVQAPSRTYDTELKQPSEKSPNTGDKWWIPIVVAMIAAFGSIVVAVLNPQLVSTIFNPRKRQNPVPVNRRLRGLVLDKVTGLGIQGAQISLEAEGIPSVQSTDAMGNFLFSFQCSEDVVRLRVGADGYQRYDRLIDFPKGTETLAVEINLSRPL